MKSFTIFLVALLAIVTFVSCSDGDSTNEKEENTSTIAPSATDMYVGKCKLSDDAQTTVVDNVMAAIIGNSVYLYKIPYDEIIGSISGKEESNAFGYADNQVLSFDLQSNSGGTTLFAFKPFSWTVYIPRGVYEPFAKYVLFFNAFDNGYEKSWGSLSKNGVLTLILNMSSFVSGIDDGTFDPDAQPTSHPVKLTFVLTKK